MPIMKIKDFDHITTLDILSSAIYKNYLARMCGDGKILQIEERIGNKLLRTIDPLSRSGRKLLNTQKIIFHMPDGEIVQGKNIREIFQKLKENSLEKIQKFPEAQEWKERLEKTIEQINGWEKLYLHD